MKEFCRKYHKNQQDKAGKDYVNEHLQHVANKFPAYSKCWYVGWLHDILEDTECNVDILKDRLKKDISNDKIINDIIESVKLLTKKDGQKRNDYLKLIKDNEIARKVKIVDLNHNSDINRFDKPNIYNYNKCMFYKQDIEYLEQ